MLRTERRLLEGYARRICPDPAAGARARDRWNSIAKPIASLGAFEGMVVQIAELTGSEDVDIGKRVVVVMCADNGVVAKGVSQSPQDVTTVVAGQVAQGTSSVCRMAASAGVDAIAVDMGMATPSDVPGVVDCSIARGTADISEGPAMTREQAVRAIEAGVGLVGDLKGEGYGLICTGEMGIGNTTTSAAMAAAFLQLPPDELTGRGAGLSDEGLARKVAAVEQALNSNVCDREDPLGVLASLGGFDIAGLVGLFIGGAVHRVPVVIDGFISILAAYTASRLCPECACAMLASHLSSEPAAARIADELGLSPVIRAGMHLGEGTGAVLLVPLLDAAVALYNGSSFDDYGIDAYEVHPQ